MTIGRDSLLLGVALLGFVLAIVMPTACTAEQRRAVFPVVAEAACVWLATADHDPELGDVCATLDDLTDGAAHAAPELVKETDAENRRKALARGVHKSRAKRKRKTPADAPTIVAPADAGGG